MTRPAALLSSLAKLPRCARCGRPEPVCVCDRLPESALRTRLAVTILQHPQEQDVVLSTAPLLQRVLDRCEIKVGLSWPSLAKSLDVREVDATRCAVLFPTERPAGLPSVTKQRVALVLDRRGEHLIPEDTIDRIVVLDGTWRQAKTLWWRNPWLSKLARISLVPREPSIYGRLRKEPKRTNVSTLEAVADALVGLGEAEEVATSLRRVMRTLSQRVRAYSGPEADPQVRRT